MSSTPDSARGDDPSDPRNENDREPTSSTQPQQLDPDQSQDADGDDIESLRSKLQETEQQVLRAHAELENFRKRAQRSVEEERKYAAAGLITDLLPVLDNLQRALSAASGDGESEHNIVQGVQMVISQLEMVLGQHHVSRIDAVGQPFDPNRHEAVGQQAHPEIPAGHVCAEIQTGYLLHDRVIRPAQVFVATAEQ